MKISKYLLFLFILLHFLFPYELSTGKYLLYINRDDSQYNDTITSSNSPKIRQLHEELKNKHLIVYKYFNYFSNAIISIVLENEEFYLINELTNKKFKLFNSYQQNFNVLSELYKNEQNKLSILKKSSDIKKIKKQKKIIEKLKSNIKNLKKNRKTSWGFTIYNKNKNKINLYIHSELGIITYEKYNYPKMLFAPLLYEYNSGVIFNKNNIFQYNFSVFKNQIRILFLTKIDGKKSISSLDYAPYEQKPINTYNHQGIYDIDKIRFIENKKEKLAQILLLNQRGKIIKKEFIPYLSTENIKEVDIPLKVPPLSIKK